MKENKKGFTLIELLVVVLIIGILAAIALPQYKLAVAKTKFASIKKLTRSIFNAEQEYYNLHDSYTRYISDLSIDINEITRTSHSGAEGPVGVSYYYANNFSCIIDYTNKVLQVSCGYVIDNTRKINYHLAEGSRWHHACITQDTNTSSIYHKLCANDTGNTYKHIGDSYIYMYD